MNTARASKILKDAWRQVEIPSVISERFEVFHLTEDSNGALAARGENQALFWLRACNPHVNRLAFGTFLTGDEVESITLEHAHCLLQSMADSFMVHASAFDEGGVLPEPIRPIAYVATKIMLADGISRKVEALFPK